MIRIGTYAGSFDMPTKGHEYMIRMGSELFDNLVVAIGINPNKKPMFSVEERTSMLEDIVKDNKLTNVNIVCFENKLLVDFAKEINSKYLLRGIRSAEDFSYEMGLKLVNEKLNKDIETVFLTPPRDLSEVSSSVVKGLIGFGHWENAVSHYVPNCVLTKLKEKFSI